MYKLGEEGYCHFLDLNKEESPYHLKYTPQVKLCEDTERKLAYLFDQCKKHYIDITPPDNIQGFIDQISRIKDTKQKAINMLLDEIVQDVVSKEKFVQDHNVQMKEALRSLQNLKDCQQVYKVALQMIPELQGQFRGAVEAPRDIDQES